MIYLRIMDPSFSVPRRPEDTKPLITAALPPNYSTNFINFIVIYEFL